VIQPTGIKNLDILPCGPIPKNPAEILNSQAFADILNVLAERYDHVVLDSPPVMPVTDARIIGAIADVTILVLRADKSTRKAGEYARDVLLSVGTNILGVVVNGIRRGRGRYGYYYGYYQYGYGERKGGDAQQKQELASST
jgi:capsular exopolysaccharide synthesis family protein